MMILYDHQIFSSQQYGGISSLILLERVRDILKEKGWQVENIDTTVIAEKPKLREKYANVKWHR